ELLELREELLALGAALGALHALLGLARGQVEAGKLRLLERARLRPPLARVLEQCGGGRRRLEGGVRVDRAGLLEQPFAARGRVRVEQPLEPVEPAGRDARERDATLLRQI